MARGTLVVTGMGPGGPAQMTLQSIETLKSCDEVLGLVQKEALQAFAKGAGIRGVGVDWSGASRGAGLSTRALSDALLKQLSRGRRIGIVVDGNPELFSPSDELAARCTAAGHHVQRFPAIGSLDELFIVVERRLGGAFTRGLTVINALSVDWKLLKIDPSLCLLVYNLGPAARRTPALLTAAGKKLASSCGRRRMCFIEIVAAGENVVETSPARLAHDLRRVGVNATLCVEPLRG